MPSPNKLVIPAAFAASLVLAACGGSSYSSSSKSTSASTPASQPVSNSSGSLTVASAKNSAGTYLTGASGRALYIWVADSNGKSACSGACAKAWPPLTATTAPQVGGGASAADITLISRSDGSKQVAYKGRPLYYYAGDSGAGMTNGQGSNQFGAKWWLISPSGGPISSGSSGASSAGGSSGTAGGYAGGGSGSSSSSSGGSSSSSGTSSSSGGGWG